MARYNEDFLDKIKVSLNATKNKLNDTQDSEHSKMIFVMENQKALKNIENALNDIIKDPDYSIEMYDKAQELLDELMSIKVTLNELLSVKDKGPENNNEYVSLNKIKMDKEQMDKIFDDYFPSSEVKDNDKETDKPITYDYKQKIKALAIDLKDISQDEQYCIIECRNKRLNGFNSLLFKMKDLDTILTEISNNLNIGSDCIYIYEISNVSKVKFKKIFEKESMFNK